jgi:ABC-type lipoprotein export system ATPase subunit
MEKIALQQVIPNVFLAQPPVDSGVWGKEITFHKGKTSFCSYLHGARADYAGRVLFDDKDIARLSPAAWGEVRRTAIGILFQGLRLFPELTALENVHLKNRLTRFRPDSWIEEAFHRLGIADKMHTPIAKTSFGQQQRVALVRALCQPLDFVLLDEPVSHLDEENGRHAATLLLQESEKQGFGIIATSIGKHLDIPYHETLLL